MPLSRIVKSAWEYFLEGFASLILPDLEIGEYEDSGDCKQSQNHEDDAFRLWDDIGGEG